MSHLGDFENAFYESLKHDFPSDIRGYTPVSCLSEKTSGAVWLVKRMADGEQFILKLCDSEHFSSDFSEEFSREYSLLNKLKDDLPGLAPMPVELFNANGYHCLVRSYFEGKTLAQFKEDEPDACTEDFCIRLGEKLCRLLSKLHACTPPIICRDIKPENILLCADGEVRIIDYGIARLENPEKETDTHFLGTASTAAPEQYGFAQTDERTDLYSLGRTLCQLLTDSYDRDALFKASVSGRLRRVLMRCTSFSPDDRYKTADALCEALTGRKQKRRFRFAVILAVLLSFAVVLGVLVFEAFKPKTISFTSEVMDTAVRLQLKKEKNEPIYPDELYGIKTLIIQGDKAHRVWSGYEQIYNDDIANNEETYKAEAPLSLKQLSLFPLLETLALDGCGLEDIKGIEKLPLRKLSIANNNISDISPLEECKNLNTLYLDNNPINDLSPLASLNLLSELYAERTDINDISSISALPVRTLRIRDTEVHDFSPLENSRRLQVLVVSKVSGAELAPLKGIPTLSRLTVLNSAVSIADINDMTYLASLDLSECGIDSLNGIEELKNLRYIGLGYNPIKDLSPLCSLPQLAEIELCYTGFIDYIPLEKCKSLKTLHITSGAQEAELYSQIPSPFFKVSLWK